MMTFKRTFIIRLKPLLSLPLLACILIASTLQAQEIVLDKIAAVVNNDIIMASDLKRIVIRIKRAGKTQLSDQELVQKVLDKMILEKIQVQKAKEIGIKIDNVALNQAMLSIAEQNKLNLEQFRVALIKEGIDYKQFRESIRDKLYSDALKKRQKRGKKTISENEIDDLIRSESYTLNQGVRYHLLDILIPAPNGISVQEFNTRLKRAQSLRRVLLASPDKLSESHIKKMGASKRDLGWKEAKTLNPASIRALSLMSVGELSNIVRDSAGFHILKLIEQQGGKRKLTQQARVRHILIPADDPKAKLKATQLRNKILSGEDFAKLAKQYSADKGSALDGGNLRMSNPDSFVPPFANAVRTLPLNTLSHPIQTRFGWHLIEVLERKTSDQTREALKQQAQKLISEKNQSEEYNNWLQGLRDEAFVEYRL